jgi:hypothetical protein
VTRGNANTPDFENLGRPEHRGSAKHREESICVDADGPGGPGAATTIIIASCFRFSPFCSPFSVQNVAGRGLSLEHAYTYPPHFCDSRELT